MSSFNGRLLHWRALALANPWPFAASFAIGALLAFVYSYVPLHTVNNRKVERLEAAVLVKETRVDSLERELADLREGTADAPDASQLAALTTERDEARRASKLAEKEADKSKRRVRKLEGERADWKSKIASLEADAKRSTELAAAPVEPVAPELPAPETGAIAEDAAEDPGQAVAGELPPAAADDLIPASPAP